MIQLRPFQQSFDARVSEAFADGARDVLGVLPCGAGKSVIAAHRLRQADAPAIFIAHRAELISGESLALARCGVRHRVIGADSLRRECSRRHVQEGLFDHIDRNAKIAIASVDTLIRLEQSDPLLRSARLVVTDEAHHLTRDNKWGKALTMFPNAVGLGLTATPLRADGKGLGRHADGVFDAMVEGPTAREVELMGFLAPHVVYAPPSDLDLSAVPVTGSGDYSPAKLADATRRSHIVGDVVQHYKRFADGLLGMTFTVDVAAAVEVAGAFKSAGVPAEVVSGTTPAELRNHIFRQFRNRKILQLVSCEIAGEGFDLPDVEVISLARATESYGLATQQIGRVKRALTGKQHGIVIDHVGNVARHCQAKICATTGEPYIAVGEREWSLDRRERRSSSKTAVLPISTCPECLRSYERVLGRTCPYCSHTVEPVGRSAPEQVDGVLRELDPAALAALHGEVLRIDGPAQIPFGATAAVGGAVVKRHRERQEAQRELRAAIAEWAGRYGRTIDEAQRAFWLEFGVDVITAQTLGRAEADALRERVTGVPVVREVETNCTCGKCGKAFYVKPSRIAAGGGEYCSIECTGRVAKTPDRFCEKCGKMFYRPPSSAANGKGKYCSKECSGKAPKEPNRTCEECGSPFYAKPSAAAKKHCSRECLDKARAKAREPNRTCEKCGGAFHCWPSRAAAGEGRYCSIACANAARRDNS